MRTIRSTYFASVAIVGLLALPAAALAQNAQSAAPAVPPAPAAASPMSSHPVPGQTMAQRVEAHIRELHAQLRITPAETPQWDQFATVMRDNARDMDRAFTQRAEQYPTMTAVQNMQSYEQIAEAHADHLQKLVPAFQNLYNVMPPTQKQLADQLFRANAEQHAQKRMQTGSNR
jgi:periplasmic protein CpxP/Spy